ncbi:CubicO group peptidase (beta-lactamase class C family) [Chitinophaga dinghuensis]|uniref:CubicO group peptidase (Beta-lactamase class C family) n=1 Tax=Chitinophaga dinghuensis TaxID=1539050 RepID=A0A327VPV0_9BACT|nr:serine hydrolase domain-containing protein [Chitinophaga dinghuensis]RAJ77365.1 CubicO group peptidase (beta-lactamase class C family) [Chitinophaga dinghuensis]
MKRLIVITLLTVVAATTFAQTLKRERLDSLLNLLQEKDKFMGSIAVAQNGNILYTRAIGYSDVATAHKADPKTKYHIGSITKMFTATLIMKAVEAKKLSLDQTLDKYYPQVENAKKITIRQMLTHRSGIHNVTNDSVYLSYYTQPKSEKELMGIIASGKSDFEPDTKAGYSNSNYIILTYILEKIYQKPYADILKEQILTPGALASTHYGGKINAQQNEAYSYLYKTTWAQDAETDPSIPLGAGAMVSTPSDLTSFITQLFAGKFVSPSTLDTMKTLRDNFGIGMGRFPYANSFAYGHTGGIDGFQSVLVYFPEEKLSVAITANGLVYPYNNLLKCALSGFFNQPFEMPVFNAVAITSESLDQFVGSYATTQIPIKIKITKADNKLYGQATGQQAFPLEASSPTTFQYEPAGVVLEFNIEKKELLLKQGGQTFQFTKE